MYLVQAFIEATFMKLCMKNTELFAKLQLIKIVLYGITGVFGNFSCESQ